VKPASATEIWKSGSDELRYPAVGELAHDDRNGDHHHHHHHHDPCIE